MSSDHLVGRISADGLVTVASSGGAEPPPPSSGECKVLERKGFLRRTFKCGHRTRSRYRLRIFGQDSRWFNVKERCAECALEHFEKVVIRCCYCGHPIFPGQPVCLYAEHSPGIDRDWASPIAVPAHRGEMVMVYVGCMLWGCGSGGGFAGHWTESGFKQLDFSQLH